MPRRSFLRRPIRVETHGEQEDGDDGKQRGGPGGQAEDDGEKDSGERGGGGYGAQSPGKKGQGKGEPDGREAGERWCLAG